MFRYSVKAKSFKYDFSKSHFKCLCATWHKNKILYYILLETTLKITQIIGNEKLLNN